MLGANINFGKYDKACVRPFGAIPSESRLKRRGPGIAPGARPSGRFNIRQRPDETIGLWAYAP